MFELTQLRGFVAVAEELHFGRAAARLNMTQPPLSRQIQLLEHALGVVLLARTSRSVRLTPAGQVLLGEARRLLRMAETAERTTRRVARGEEGQVTLGFTAASSYAFLPRLLALARAGLPEVRITLRELVTQDQLEALVSGEIDLGLVRPPVARRGIEAVRVLREPLLLALPEGHALASGRAPVPADLDRQPLLSYSPVEGRYFHALSSQMFQAAGVAPDVVQHVTQTHSILALVRAGMGVALVPEAARSLGLEGVVLRQMDTGTPLFADLFLAWRPDNPNPAVLPMRALLLRELGGEGGAVRIRSREAEARAAERTPAERPPRPPGGAAARIPS